MKSLVVRIFSIIAVAVGTLAPAHGQTRGVPSPAGVKLVLETVITKTEYCSTAPHLQLYLSLKFTNRGDKAIIIDRQSYRISRDMVSRDHSAKRNYLQKGIWNLDLAGIGFTRKAPSDLTPFKILKSGESFIASEDRRVNLLVGVSERESLRPGKYFLQVRVITWYYHDYSAIDRLRTEWQDRGYLWSDDVTSEPMAFEVDNKPTRVPCSVHAA